MKKAVADPQFFGPYNKAAAGAETNIKKQRTHPNWNQSDRDMSSKTAK